MHLELIYSSAARYMKEEGKRGVLQGGRTKWKYRCESRRLSFHLGKRRAL